MGEGGWVGWDVGRWANEELVIGIVLTHPVLQPKLFLLCVLGCVHPACYVLLASEMGFSFCSTTENAIQAFGNGSDVTMWQPAPPVQTTTATTTTAFRIKNKPLGPAGSENEIPTHVLPPCANLQASSGWFPSRADFWEDCDHCSKGATKTWNPAPKVSLFICMTREPMGCSMCMVWKSEHNLGVNFLPWVLERGSGWLCLAGLVVSFGIDLSHLRLTHPHLCLLPHKGAGITSAC